MTGTPRNVDELRAIKDPEKLVHAATDFIERAEDAIADARAERDKALGQLADEHGPAKTARMFDLSLSTVKNAHRTYRATKAQRRT